MALARWETETLMLPGEPPSLLELARRPAWMARAACRGMEQTPFFPPSGEPGDKAREVCAGCPVREDCLRYAVESEVVGVWAGTSKRERRAMRRKANRGRTF